MIYDQNLLPIMPILWSIILKPQVRLQM